MTLFLDKLLLDDKTSGYAHLRVDDYVGKIDKVDSQTNLVVHSVVWRLTQQSLFLRSDSRSEQKLSSADAPQEKFVSASHSLQILVSKKDSTPVANHNQEQVHFKLAYIVHRC